MLLCHWPWHSSFLLRCSWHPAPPALGSPGQDTSTQKGGLGAPCFCIRCLHSTPSRDGLRAPAPCLARMGTPGGGSGSAGAAPARRTQSQPGAGTPTEPGQRCGGRGAAVLHLLGTATAPSRATKYSPGPGEGSGHCPGWTPVPTRSAATRHPRDSSGVDPHCRFLLSAPTGSPLLRETAPSSAHLRAPVPDRRLHPRQLFPSFRGYRSPPEGSLCSIPHRLPSLRQRRGPRTPGTGGGRGGDGTEVARGHWCPRAGAGGSAQGHGREGEGAPRRLRRAWCPGSLLGALPATAAATRPALTMLRRGGPGSPGGSVRRASARHGAAAAAVPSAAPSYRRVGLGALPPPSFGYICMRGGSTRFRGSGRLSLSRAQRSPKMPESGLLSLFCREASREHPTRLRAVNLGLQPSGVGEVPSH